MAQAGSAQLPSQRPSGNPLDNGAGATSQSRQGLSKNDVEAALRVLPSYGWTSGWTGRRDRALLVLSQMAGLSQDSIAELTVGDISIADGVATIHSPGGTTILRKVEDDLICGPCALARWVRALDLTAVYPNGRVAAAIIARAAPLTADSPHLCQGTISVTDVTRRMAVLPTTDQWGPYADMTPPVAPTSVGLPFQRTRASSVSAGRTPLVIS